MKVRGSKGWSLDQQFEQSRDVLFRYALSLCRAVDRADDLVQECFLRAVQHAETLHRLNEFQREAWLKRTLRNRFFDEQRSRQRSVKRLDLLIRQARRGNGFFPQITFEEILDQVPAVHRTLFEMPYRDGMSSGEIGSSLGVPAATVRTRLRQGILALRRQMMSS